MQRAFDHIRFISFNWLHLTNRHHQHHRLHKIAIITYTFVCFCSDQHLYSIFLIFWTTPPTLTHRSLQFHLANTNPHVWHITNRNKKAHLFTPAVHNLIYTWGTDADSPHPSSLLTATKSTQRPACGWLIVFSQAAAALPPCSVSST